MGQALNEQSAGVWGMINKARESITQAPDVAGISREDFGILVSGLAAQCLEDFNTVKTYCLECDEAPGSEEKTGRSLRESVEQIIAGFADLHYHAAAIRTGEVAHW